MERTKEFLRKNRFIMVYLLIYFVLNLLFLAKFPFMHSDESWLSGLTRSMTVGGISSAESFFDLLPRNPHAIKIIYHGIQAVFYFIFGYNLFAFRLISLLAGVSTLYLFHKLTGELVKDKWLQILATIALSVCIQFIYASHFARQEIIILAVMTGLFYFIIKNKDNWNYGKDITAAVITGVSIGIHPNSFLAALCAGSVYLYFIVVEKKIKLKNLFLYICITGGFAGLFIGISYLMDPNFIQNYLRYGSELGVTSTVAVKYDGIVPFYDKLFRQSSGTYYTPNVRGELIIIAAASFVSLVAGIRDRKLILPVLPLAAMNFGIMLIGRYSQPSVIFIFPFGILAAFMLLSSFKGRGRTVAAILICAGFLINSIGETIPYINNDYEEYISAINENIPAGETVLANLNAGYAFKEGQFYDYRNLAYLDEEGLSFEEYISKREIGYIIYPDEMDLIYERRPVWNIVYGNLYPYYDDMQEYIETNCTLVESRKTPYAMRIRRFTDDRDWEIRIYRVNE